MDSKDAVYVDFFNTFNNINLWVNGEHGTDAEFERSELGQLYYLCKQLRDGEDLVNFCLRVTCLFHNERERLPGWETRHRDFYDVIQAFHLQDGCNTMTTCCARGGLRFPVLSPQTDSETMHDILRIMMKTAVEVLQSHWVPLFLKKDNRNTWLLLAKKHEICQILFHSSQFFEKDDKDFLHHLSQTTCSCGREAAVPGGPGGAEQQARQPDSPQKPAEIPQKPAERPQKPAERPQKPAERPQKPAEIPQKPAERPQKPAERPQKPAERPQKPAERPQKPAEIPQKPAEIPQKPAERPQKPAERPQKPAEIPQKPAERPQKPARDLRSQPRDLRSQPRYLRSQLSYL
ncbi:hypothetical protein CRUP_029908 [Coryphaenoides rupestris]|nr:hypothetical protein CRUP_029908 [Coryphaenoides rupestris]